MADNKISNEKPAPATVHGDAGNATIIADSTHDEAEDNEATEDAEGHQPEAKKAQTRSTP